MDNKELTREDFNRYLERNGIKAKRTLSILGKTHQLVNALNHPVGLEFLRILMNRMELNRAVYDDLDIDNTKAKFIEARARYKEAQAILESFLGIMETHEAMLNEVKTDLKK